MKQVKVKIPFLMVFAMALVFIQGCNKSNTVVEPDENSQQTIIINTNGSDPGAELSSKVYLQLNEYAFLDIFHFKTERTEYEWPEAILFGNHTQFNLHVIKDRDSLAFADLGTVQIGDSLLGRFEDGYYEGKYSSGLSPISIADSIVYPDIFYKSVFYRYPDIHDPNPVFAGSTPFAIKNSPDIQDVSIDLDLPPQNLITNVSLGQVIDPNTDWTITFQYTLEPQSSAVFLRERNLAKRNENRENGRYLYDGFAGLGIKLTEAANSITIPSAELVALRDSCDVNLFTLSFSVYQIIDQIVLVDKNNNQVENLDILFTNTHQVEFMFKEEN